MNPKNSILFTCGLLVSMAACSDDPEIQDFPEPSTTIDLIQNPGFEDDKAEVQTPVGWIVTGDTEAVKVTTGGCEGLYALVYDSPSAYSVTTQQTIEGVEDGMYDLEFYYKSSGGQEACYVSIGSADNDQRMTSLHVSPHTWSRSLVRGFKVEGGQFTLRITSQSEGGNWNRVDGLRLKKSEEEYLFLKGGDLSLLTYVEQMGGKFYDENGTERDCVELLSKNGFNIARLRLYNDPGHPDYTPSNRLPVGIQNPADILNLAKRATQAGMQILLTFHYSDYWTNGESQYKPYAWESLGYEELKKAVYDFTYDFMTQMKNQGTTPAFVALGNETVSGILFPDGDTEHFDQMAELFNQGYEAVKAVSPETTVIIHLDDAGDKNKYDWFFTELNRYGGQYDMIGASYYPFWTGKTVAEMTEWADYISSRYDKDIFLMESGYNWNPTLPSGKPGQLSHNGPYQDVYPSSPQGQKDFLLELFTGIKNASGRRIAGSFYWDPVMIAVPGVGWELEGENVVSNTTLFDFSGKLLPSIHAYMYNN